MMMPQEPGQDFSFTEGRVEVRRLMASQPGNIYFSEGVALSKKSIEWIMPESLYTCDASIILFNQNAIKSAIWKLTEARVILFREGDGPHSGSGLRIHTLKVAYQHLAVTAL